MSITIQNVISEMNLIAPTWQKCANDPIGLQIGNPQSTLSGILLALDATPQVIDEAIAKQCNLIITHHPRIFSPLNHLAETTLITQLLTKAIRHDLAIFSAHTNLDIAQDGVNDTVADLCKMQSNRKPLTNEIEIPEYQIVTFCPPNAKNRIKKAAWKAGAGTIGNYRNCAFSQTGEGTFFATDDCQPSIGKNQEQTQLEEIRLEFTTTAEVMPAALQAIKAAHPYEEPVCHVYPLKSCKSMGLGRVGKLEQETTLQELASYLYQQTQSPMIQLFGAPQHTIKKIGVWSGSGIKIGAVQKHQLDAIITGELSYHALEQLQAWNCCVITLGHAHIETIILPKLQQKLQQKFADIPIILSQIPLLSLQNFEFSSQQDQTNE